MKTNLLLKTGVVLLVSTLIHQPATAFAQGTAFTYQGRLDCSGTPASGRFDLTFSVWNAASGPAQESITLTHASVPVSNGLFTVALEFGSGVFTGADRWLEIGVRTNGGGAFITLIPRQKLTSTPYAILSGNLSGTLPAGQLSGTLSTTTLPAGGNWPLNTTLTLDATTLSVDPVNHRVGIGTSSPDSPLTVATGTGYGLEHTDGARRLATFLDAGGCWFGSVSADKLYFFVNNGLSSMTMDLGGRVGIGTDNPADLLHLVGGIGSARLDSTSNPNGSVLELRNTMGSPNYLGAINFNNAAGTYPGQIGYLASHDLIFRTAGAERMRLASSGRLDVTGVSSSVNLNANGFAGAFSGAVRIAGDSSHAKPFLQIHETQDGDYARIQLQVADRPVWHISAGGADNSVVFYNSTNSIVTSISEGGVLTTKVLTITGGADIAEPFRMSQPDLSKGSVVVIDKQNPGHLKLSTEAYDQRVAGIISGAGGVNTGLSLSQHGTMEGDQHVALTGRVYVQADNSNGPINPGDLLTTSATPGRAMKVTDHARAQGATLGKAMTALNEDSGLVLVLVTLQ